MKELLSRQFWTEPASCHLEYRKSQPPFPMHNHDFFELVVIYRGKGIHTDQKESFELSEGDLLCVHPGQFHSYTEVKDLELMNIMIRPDFFYDLNEEITKIPSYSELFTFNSRSKKASVSRIHLNKIQLLAVKEIIASIQNEFSQDLPLVQIKINCLLLELIIYILRAKENPDFPAVNKKSSASILVQYMEKNYQRNISMQDLMEIGAMSESSVLRAFKHLTGYSPFVYQNKLRMLYATTALAESSTDITTIAYQCGFNDSNYFSRSFKKFVGMTPSEYRQKFSSVKD
ncbi:helix-turn-helix domain-containing protein [Treponema sp.]|uniref:helix-turn-helix domain-containing protein n=1 Tax=Treponema sp. TaxID=166 RepID=UPI0025D5DEC7|nr:helix-turn-helix domain-containing protein [Treponema sp.]MCR5217759.1 helix-turn-helix domain-containing protein [Treponema sp.]